MTVFDTLGRSLQRLAPFAVPSPLPSPTPILAHPPGDWRDSTQALTVLKGWYDRSQLHLLG